MQAFDKISRKWNFATRPRSRWRSSRHLSKLPELNIARYILHGVIFLFHVLWWDLPKPRSILPRTHVSSFSNDLTRTLGVGIDVVPKPNEDIRIKLQYCIPNRLPSKNTYNLSVYWTLLTWIPFKCENISNKDLNSFQLSRYCWKKVASWLHPPEVKTIHGSPFYHVNSFLIPNFLYHQSSLLTITNFSAWVQASREGESDLGSTLICTGAKGYAGDRCLRVYFLCTCGHECKYLQKESSSKSPSCTLLIDSITTLSHPSCSGSFGTSKSPIASADVRETNE